MILVDVTHRIEEQTLSVHRVDAIAAIIFIYLTIRRHSLSHHEIHTAAIAVVADDIAVGTDFQIVSHIGIDIHTE